MGTGQVTRLRRERCSPDGHAVFTRPKRASSMMVPHDDTGEAHEMTDRPTLAVPGYPGLYFGPAHRNHDDSVDVTVYRKGHKPVLDLCDLPSVGWAAVAVRRVTYALSQPAAA
jgi:hypothetical protein